MKRASPKLGVYALEDVVVLMPGFDVYSQLLEAMSLIPICRAAAEKLILVGDPLQLSPPISTYGNNSIAGKGLSRTLFDRFSEV